MLKNDFVNYINLSSAIHALIGYTSSLKAGSTITANYLERLVSHYTQNVLKALEPFDPSTSAEKLTVKVYGPFEGFATLNPRASTPQASPLKNGAPYQPKMGETWLHLKSDHLYTVLGVTNTGAHTRHKDKFPVTVIYTRRSVMSPEAVAHVPLEEVFSRPLWSFQGSFQLHSKAPASFNRKA